MLLALATLAACSGIDLDPTSHHVFARETGPIVNPPPGLLRGTSQ
jgi:hypothetical protein